MDGATFTLRATAYSPTPVGQNVSAGYSFWQDSAQPFAKDFPAIKAMGANAVRVYDGTKATQAALNTARANELYVIMGMFVSQQDVETSTGRVKVAGDFTAMVSSWAAHPAVLMWELGNEVTHNREGDLAFLTSWYTLLNYTAGVAKSTEIAKTGTFHPVGTSNMDINHIGVAAVKADDASLTNPDLWGATAYRGTDFQCRGPVFIQYSTSSAKPLYLSETGSDAYNSTTAKEDQEMQSAVVTAQWPVVQSNLSVSNSTNVLVGAVFFEWSDEWWKSFGTNNTSNSVQDTPAAGDYENSCYAEPKVSEEWWGLTAIKEGTAVRKYRRAYYSLRSLWNPTAVGKADIFYSDAGIPAETSVIAYSSDNAAVFDGNSAAVTPPEGSMSFQTAVASSTYAGWGVFYDAANFKDYSLYKPSGELKFWVRSATNSIKVEMEHILSGNPVTTAVAESLPNWNWSLDHDQWKQYVFPLANLPAAIDFTKLRCPFKITALTQNTTFYADYVRFTSSATVAAFGVALKNRVTHSTSSVLSWPDVALPAGWVLADQYIQIDADPNTHPWGIQIFTENLVAEDADPKFVRATPNDDPAGLVDTSSTSKRLPLAWRITDLPQGAAPAVSGPNGADSNRWIILKDRNTTGFVDGEVAVTLKNTTGIHYGGFSFVPTLSPDFVFMAADFTNAVMPRVYKTTTLRVNLYHE